MNKPTVTLARGEPTTPVVVEQCGQIDLDKLERARQKESRTADAGGVGGRAGGARARAKALASLTG